MKKRIFDMLPTAVFVVAIFVAIGIFYSRADLMAGNQTTQSPWYIDTSGVTPETGTARIRMIAWFDCTTNGHDFVLVDNSGTTIFADTSGQAGVPHFYSNLDITTTGIGIQKLDSGYLLIDVQQKSY